MMILSLEKEREEEEEEFVEEFWQEKENGGQKREKKKISPPRRRESFSLSEGALWPQLNYLVSPLFLSFFSLFPYFAPY